MDESIGWSTLFSIHIGSAFSASHFETSVQSFVESQLCNQLFGPKMKKVVCRELALLLLLIKYMIENERTNMPTFLIGLILSVFPIFNFSAAATERIRTSVSIQEEIEKCVKAGGGDRAACRQQVLEEQQSQSGREAKSEKDEKFCKDATAKFDEAISELGGACSTVNLSSDPASCLKEIANCGEKDDGDDDSRACPHKGADTNKKKDAAHKATEDLKKSNQKSPNWKSRSRLLETELTEKTSALDEKERAAMTEFKNKEAEAQLALNGELSKQKQQALAIIQQKEDEYDKMDIDMHAIPIQMADAESKTFLDPLDTLKVSCAQQGIQIVAAKRAKKLADLAKKKYTYGGFKAMVAKMGMSDKDRDKIAATKERKDCEKNREFKIKEGSYKRARTNALKAIQFQRDALVKRMANNLKKSR